MKKQIHSCSAPKVKQLKNHKIYLMNKNKHFRNLILLCVLYLTQQMTVEKISLSSRRKSFHENPRRRKTTRERSRVNENEFARKAF